MTDLERMIRRALRPAPRKPGADLLDSAGEPVSTWYGFSSARRNRRTGTLIVVIDDHGAQFDADSMTDYGDGPAPWWTVCDEHSTLVCHQTRKVAESHAARPEGWCETCREIVEGEA